MLKSPKWGFVPVSLRKLERERNMTRKKMIKAGLAMAAAMVVMTGCGNHTAAESAEATAAAPG